MIEDYGLERGRLGGDNLTHHSAADARINRKIGGFADA
jgi:hypothetical protein